MYVIERGRARLVPVDIAHRNTAFAEVVNGVSEGSLVILHPSDRVSDGVRVTAISTVADVDVYRRRRGLTSINRGWAGTRYQVVDLIW